MPEIKLRPDVGGGLSWVGWLIAAAAIVGVILRVLVR